MYLNFAKCLQNKTSIYSYNQMDICLSVKTRKTSDMEVSFPCKFTAFAALRT